MKSIKNQQWNPNLVKDCWRCADWGVADLKWEIITIGSNQKKSRDHFTHWIYAKLNPKNCIFFSILESLIGHSKMTMMISIHRLMQSMQLQTHFSRTRNNLHSLFNQFQIILAPTQLNVTKYNRIWRDSRKITVRILCTFLVSNKACEVKCAKLFEVFYAPRMHSSDGHDTGPKENRGDIWEEVCVCVWGGAQEKKKVERMWGQGIWGSQKHE